MNIWIDAQLYQVWLNTYNLRRLGEAERNPTSVRDNSWVPLRSTQPTTTTTTTTTIEINSPHLLIPPSSHLPCYPGDRGFH